MSSMYLFINWFWFLSLFYETEICATATSIKEEHGILWHDANTYISTLFNNRAGSIYGTFLGHKQILYEIESNNFP